MFLGVDSVGGHRYTHFGTCVYVQFGGVVTMNCIKYSIIVIGYGCKMVFSSRY